MPTPVFYRAQSHSSFYPNSYETSIDRIPEWLYNSTKELISEVSNRIYYNLNCNGVYEA